MNCPRSIAISENRVFLCQFNSIFVLVHDLSGNLCVCDRVNNIYVCDSKNNRIQMFYKDLPLKSQFGRGIVERPYDIKLINEFIYYLATLYLSYTLSLMA